MTAANVSNYVETLRRRYPNGIANVTIAKSKALETLTRNTDFGGEGGYVAWQFANPAGVGANFTNARANVNPSQFLRPFVTRKKYYVVGQVDGELLKASEGKSNAIVKAFEREVESATRRLAQRLSAWYYGNGGGSLGKGASLTSATDLLLARPDDHVNFYVGDPVSTNVTDGTSGSATATNGYIASVMRDGPTKGTLQVTATRGSAAANWATVFAGFAATDYLFGDYGDFGAVPAGVGVSAASTSKKGWTPNTAPTSGDSWFGVDRSADPTMNAGQRYLGNGQDFGDSIIDAVNQAIGAGGDPKTVKMHHLDLSTFEKSRQSRTMIVDSKGDLGLPFKGVPLMGPNGPLALIGDPYCPRGKFVVTQDDTWEMVSAGEFPTFLTYGITGNMLTVNDADAVEFRIGGYGNFTCDAPAFSVNGTF